MSIKNWNAGIIRPVPVAPTGPYQDGSAPGVWTLDQVAYWLQQGLWPIAGNVLPPARALFSGNGTDNTIDYVTIATTGNATDFGDMLANSGYRNGACASTTRGIFFGGGSSGRSNIIQYVTIATAGNASDFGDLTATAEQCSGYNNSTRGVLNLGNDNVQGYSNTINYITIATTGDASDFGDLTVARGWNPAACSSPTRGITAGGSTNASAVNVIDYTTIATTGNATDFGDTTEGYGIYATAGCSSSTRGIILAGVVSDGAASNVIMYITIATTGNTTDFGDLSAANSFMGSSSSNTRGLIGGGSWSPQNTIDYITIATTGNASDFGDLTVGRQYISSCSSANGGVQ